MVTTFFKVLLVACSLSAVLFPDPVLGMTTGTAGSSIFPFPREVQGGSASLRLDESYTRRTNEADPEPASPSAAPADSPDMQGTALADGGTAHSSYNLMMIVSGLFLLLMLKTRKRGKVSEEQPIQPPQEESVSTTPSPEPELENRNRAENGASANLRPLSNTRTESPSAQKIPHADSLPRPNLSINEIRAEAQRQGTIDAGQLIRLLESSQSAYVHSRALYLLGRYRVREALPMILKAIAHRHRWIRLAAASALVKLKSDVVEERLLEMADHRDPMTRATTLLVLSRIGTACSHKIVRQSIWDFAPSVREAAALAIGRLKVPNADFDIQQARSDFEEEVRNKAEWAFRKIHETQHKQSG